MVYSTPNKHSLKQMFPLVPYHLTYTNHYFDLFQTTNLTYFYNKFFFYLFNITNAKLLKLQTRKKRVSQPKQTQCTIHRLISRLTILQRVGKMLKDTLAKVNNDKGRQLHNQKSATFSGDKCNLTKYPRD